MSELTDAIKLEQWGCYVWLSGSTILSCEIGDYETGNVEECYGEVSAPHSQEFLNDVNEAFGTEFEMDEFPGR